MFKLYVNSDTGLVSVIDASKFAIDENRAYKTEFQTKEDAIVFLNTYIKGTFIDPNFRTAENWFDGKWK